MSPSVTSDLFDGSLDVPLTMLMVSVFRPEGWEH